MIMLAVTGVLAFMQERRLLAIQQLAETEGRREQLLDDFESNLRELRREGVNYVLLGGSTSLNDFHRAAAAVDASVTAVGTLGESERLEAILAAVREYVRAYQKVVTIRQTQGREAALQETGEVVGEERLEQILIALRELERTDIMSFAERGAQITAAARTAVLIIGVFVVLAAAMILVSVMMLFRYYTINKSLLAETIALNAKLEASRREMEAIISFVSHDLRAPLINIKGFSDALATDTRRLAEAVDKSGLPAEMQAKVRDLVREDVPESLGFIRSAADTMERLIATMVKVARAGQFPVQPRRVDVKAVIEGIIRDFEFRILETGARIQVDPLPACTADVDQVRQVFSNLIDNAIKYREPSRPLEVRITGTVEAGQSVYCVADNGVGIDEKDLACVMEMYYQVKERAAEGQGLGLAIARKLVERNGGTLEVQSELHRGSRFFVRLKAAE